MPARGEQDPADVVTMRETARRALGLGEPPRADELDLLLAQLRGQLAVMIPEVESLAGRRLPGGEQAAGAALACAREARRLPQVSDRQAPDEGADLARRLARALTALCDHHDILDHDRS
ncbi:DUF6415 family natural product biosynthesis protein [Streptomyces maremycinicus]|uniref:DUF6415 family natural product biosynthesis protein n=1 Tax=Streptomyces maremycinicus TaxID=1679753 RepID=UPI000A6C3B9D|nr:DUF6415 family natural product biosynthesis protein [Streptomyces sp. NBRC 110468]